MINIINSNVGKNLLNSIIFWLLLSIITRLSLLFCMLKLIQNIQSYNFIVSCQFLLRNNFTQSIKYRFQITFKFVNLTSVLIMIMYCYKVNNKSRSLSIWWIRRRWIVGHFRIPHSGMKILRKQVQQSRRYRISIHRIISYWSLLK